MGFCHATSFSPPCTVGALRVGVDFSSGPRIARTPLQRVDRRVQDGANRRCGYADENNLQAHFWARKLVLRSYESKQLGTDVSYQRIKEHYKTEHVEKTDVQSGDATFPDPAQKLFVKTHMVVTMMGAKLCKALRVSGFFNVQVICNLNDVKVIECTFRASRSLTFISMTYNVKFRGEDTVQRRSGGHWRGSERQLS